ncbi:MAG: GNAT family N-acetyltransferase [Planctomycetales bacterium]|nr:GNAT family N-acetyltransferase [Planctomycetales bacterium]
MNSTPIQLAETDEQIVACLPVLRQLRPHLIDPDDAVARVRRQQQSGFRLAYLTDGDDVVAVTGFRLLENLAWGKFLYVDDLVTDDARRSCGHGERLLAWLIDLAKEAGCDQVHLDSGVQRFDAHRFYLRHRFRITSHHFAIPLQPSPK